MVRSDRLDVITVLLLLGCWGGYVSPVLGAAQEATLMKGKAPADLSFNVGVGTWISEGRTEWNHDASGVDATLGNPSSELAYKKVRSKALEINGKLITREQFFIRGTIGYGIIDDGTLVDDDFLSAAGAAANGTSVSGAHMFSRTESNIDDNFLWYVTLDAGIPVFSLFSNKMTIGVFGGYQHWRERVSAQGVNQLNCTAVGTLCSAPGSSSFTGQDAITNTVQWDSFRVGFDVEYQILERLGMTGSLAFIPYTLLENQDIHHLRSDLLKDPSFTMTGTGYGYQAEAGFQFMLINNLYLKAGFRYWRLKVTDGEWRDHPRSSASSTLTLNDFSSVRYGGTVGLSYAF